MNMKKHKARQFPQGKLRADDEGALMLRVAADPIRQVVAIDFGGIKVSWIALPKNEALEFAELLKTHALSLPDVPAVNSPPAEDVQ
jgi:hypothetical protein